LVARRSSGDAVIGKEQGVVVLIGMH
jgi:hypothetical protein